MKRIIVLCALLIVTGTNLVFAQGHDQDPYARQMYHIAIVEQGPNFKPMGTDEYSKVQMQLLAGLRELDKEGILITGGPVNDGSPVELILILKIETLTEAQALVNSAPNVQNGFWKVQLYPWFGRAGLKADPPRTQ